MGKYERVWESLPPFAAFAGGNVRGRLVPLFAAFAGGSVRGGWCRLLPHLRAVVCVAADAACFKSLKIGVWVYSFDMSNSILLVIMPLAPMAMKLRASAGSSE